MLQKNTITPDVSKKFDLYPNKIREQMLEIRNLVMEVVDENQLGSIEETLKWGEPAYLTKNGSTLRVDWKAKTPSNIYIFFNCRTTLVETFKEIYFDFFRFEGNRAIVLDVGDDLPVEELKHVLLLALTYHQIKHLPLLGVS